MKDVIDVLQLQIQRDRNRSRITAIDYKEQNNDFYVVRFIHECGVKLIAKPLTIAAAAVLYHKFFREATTTGYDKYLIAATALYLAGKMKDDPLKIRDVINVAYCTLQRGSAPLDLGDEYWNMRDAIVQAELLVMRMLKFEVTIVHPLKYMLHYLKSLQGWLLPEEWTNVPITEAAVAFLQDFHHDSSILDYKPQQVAIACINLALQCYGVQVPYTDEDEGMLWYSVLDDELTKDKLWEIMEKIMDVYNQDPHMES